ncbi:MAG: hypothetical protein LQ343_002183 [Gyalolechia ehrenbergii]|nr:MAG: hypothetical protein LQ343_002183 [Gyalolechia ehrenbergii]
MAPIQGKPDTSFPQVELDLRSILSLTQLKRVDSISPLQAGSYLLTRDAPPGDHHIKPGSGAFDPRSINNRGIQAMIALFGAGMVLASIWFFFWAKNGGFHFKQGDWEEYKSTVLRRKGPNGTTLSGATRTTALGGGSIVADGSRDGDFEDVPINEKAGKKKGRKAKKAAPRGSKNNHDEDVRAYRHEKPARVGGLNRTPDASYHHDFAHSSTEPTESETTQTSYTPFIQNFVPINTPRKSKDKAEDKKESKTPTRNNRSSSFYTHTPGSTDSHRPLRAHQYDDSSNNSTPTRSRQSSPRKNPRQPSMPGSYGIYTEPLDFESRYTSVGGSEAGETDDSRGTKAYVHPIPGLGAGNSRPGKRSSGNGGYGFRRGGARGRRDSLSDSEGETMAS